MTKVEFMKYSDSKFDFGTKAETLSRLQSVLVLSEIPQFMYFNVNEWEQEEDRIIKKIDNHMTNPTIIIRSSANCEDTECQTMAGKYSTIPYQ